MEEKPHVDRSEEPATLESNQPNARSESPRTSVLAILCVFCSSLGFFLLPAIAAVPLGVGALRTIDASKGRLRGRHLAVVGLCVSVVALSLWFLFFTVTWAGVNLVSGLVEMLMVPFG
jgi:hypothetical protein